MEPRSAWGAKPPKSTDPLPLSKVERLFIHYVGAGRAPVGRDAEAGMLRSIQADHMGKGWKDIGYSFAVGQSGTVWECRGWGVVDGATRGQGGVSLSICWLGNKEVPSDAALRAIDGWVAEARNRLGRDVPVLGHRQNPKYPGETDCPGDEMQRIIDGGRWTVKQKEDSFMEPKVLLRDKDQRIWLCWGIFRKHVPTPTQVELLKFVGVQDRTNVDSTALIETLSRVP
ncbi:MAG: N-acetylmuramoyl-L-alanine amidase [Acidimicrobiales bacterium]|nr:N-acetylmuramoyl-L-alanine amidase [Acidimicrobiales bacterium]